MAQALDRAQMHRAETRAAEQSRFLSEMSAVVAGSLDYRDTIRGAVQVLVPSFADMATVHLIDESGALVRGGVAHKDPAVETMLENADGINVQERRDVLNAARLAEGATMLHDDLRTDGQILSDLQHRRAIDTMGIRSTISVPLVARSETIGILDVYKRQHEHGVDCPHRGALSRLGYFRHLPPSKGPCAGFPVHLTG